MKNISVTLFKFKQTVSNHLMPIKTMMRLLVVLDFLIATAANAQKPKLPYQDSLEQVLPKVSGLAKLNVIKQLCGYYQNADVNKAIRFAELGIAEARKLKRDSNVCVFNNYKAETLLYKGDFKTAIALFNLNYQLANRIQAKVIMAIVLVDMGTAYQMQGDYVTAQDYFFKCLALSEQLHHGMLVALCNMDICSVFINQNNFDKTIEYANKILKYGLSHKKDFLLTKAYEYLGTAKSKQGKYDEAIKYYNLGLNLYQAENNPMGVATLYGLMAFNYVNDVPMQIKLGLKAKAMWDKISPENEYAINNLGNLGQYYANQAAQPYAKNGGKNNRAQTAELYNKAQFYMSQAVALAKKTNSKQNIIAIAGSLAAIQATVGKYQQAYANLKLYNTINDSVYSQDSKNKIASIEGQHEIALRDKQLLINKLELANQQKQRWLLITGLAMLVVIAGLIYFQSNIRKKANAALFGLNTQLEEANKVKTKFFSILNHDLRTPVVNFINFLHLQQNAADLMDEASKAAYAKKATASAETLLATMEDLLLWSKGQMENFKPVIKPVAVSYLYEEVTRSLPDNSNVEIEFKQQPGLELMTDEHYVKTIMHNLTNNAIKALANTGNPRIIWNAWAADGVAYLSITDNGPGATEVQLKPLYDDSAAIGIKSGLGLHIVRDLAKAIGCTVTVNFNAEKGVEVKLQFC